MKVPQRLNTATKTGGMKNPFLPIKATETTYKSAVPGNMHSVATHRIHGSCPQAVDPIGNVTINAQTMDPKTV